MDFTKVSPDAFKQLQLNAGVLLSNFSVKDRSFDDADIIGATSGGVAFATNPEYTDFGEDIDNVPANTKQLKRLTSVDPALSGTFKTVTSSLVQKLIASADSATVTDASGVTKITPRNSIDITKDFMDIWWVGDYGEGGFMAIHLSNALNTAGFQIQSNDDGKGDFSFEFHAHYDIDDVDTVPYEVYVAPASAA